MMRAAHALVLVALLGVDVARADPASPMHDALQPHRWQHRLLLVFSPHPDDPRARELDRALAARACALDERDVVVGRLPAAGDARLGTAVLAPDGSARIRRDLGIGREAFSVVLIGKDGGEKLRRSSVPALDDVFALIDAMPMRIDEMRAGGRRCPA